MAERLPPLSALRAFASAGRHLSFQRAATELSVTPTAISHQIRRLEEDLGVTLFRRLTRSLQLTEAGQSLLPEVAGAFDKLAGAVERLKASGDGGVLTISSITTLCFRWLAPRLPRFQAVQPRIEVRLEASARMVDFAREEVDVVIRHGGGSWPGLTAHRLFDDRFTPLISPKLLAKGPPLRKPADVFAYPLLREVAPHTEWGHWFSAAGIKPPGDTRGSMFNSSQLAAQAAVGELGIALVDPDFFAEEIANGRLVQPFRIIASSGKANYLAYPTAYEERPKVAAFREWLLAEAAAFRRESEPAQAKARRAAR
jgi:LysR family glycine cleavage system transcriptional activator